MGNDPRILALVLFLTPPGRGHAASLRGLSPRNLGPVEAEGITYIRPRGSPLQVSSKLSFLFLLLTSIDWLTRVAKPSRIASVFGDLHQWTIPQPEVFR